MTPLHEPPAPSDPAAAADAEAAAIARRGLYVRLMVILTAGIFLATASLIYYRWATTEEPSAILVFNGAPEHAGISIEVTEGLDSTTKYSAIIGQDDRYTVRFFLNPGLYHIRIFRGDHVYFEDQRGMRANYSITIPLTSVIPIEELPSEPSTQ